MLAGFVGLAIVGLLVAATGAIFLMKGIKTFSKESLAPERTIHTIQRLKATDEQIAVRQEAVRQEVKPEPKESSKDIQARVEETENRMTNTLDQLGQRLSPSHINAQVKHRIQEKPYQSGFVAMAAGLVSGLFITRAVRRS